MQDADLTKLRKIGSRVGRNQATVKRTCDRWMQEGTTGRCGRSYPPQCTNSCEDRPIVRMAVMNRSVTSRTVAQNIESVTHLSVSARAIRRCLQQSGLSARRPLLGPPLTQNHRRFRRQCCLYCRVTHLSATPRWLDSSLETPWREDAEQLRNASGIMVWGCIGYHSRTPLVRIVGTLNRQRYTSEVLEPVVIPYLQALATAILQ
ncbi:transposable element Tcb1 transposase [Trichonephila clavipes]|nr:transposable element Tcb1 transposase [Trichonephila clavipes]